MMDTPDALAAAVLHEIKNPVALALAHVRLLRMADEADLLPYHCDHIEKALDNVIRLATHFSCMAQALAETPQAIDLSALLSQLMDTYRAAWPAMDFIYRPPGGTVKINGAELPVRMIFTNLLKNAVEATAQEGQVIMTVTRNGAEVAVALRDNGPGLEAGAAIVSEEPGCSLASDTSGIAGTAASAYPAAWPGRFTTKPHGTGMGLRSSRLLAERYGGQLRLYNHPAGGCEAVVRLPVLPDT